MSLTIRERVILAAIARIENACPAALVEELRPDPPSERHLPFIELVDQGHVKVGTTTARARFEMRLELSGTFIGTDGGDAREVAHVAYADIIAALFDPADPHWLDAADNTQLIETIEELRFEVMPEAGGEHRTARLLLGLAIQFSTAHADRRQARP